MVRRRRRRKSLTVMERERFVRDVTEMYRKLHAYTLALTPLCDEYKAVMKLSDALIEAIRDVTGDDPEWCKVQPSWYPQ